MIRTDRRRALRREWVRIFFRASTSTKWRRVGKVPTNRSGRYRVNLTVSRNGRLRALAPDGTASVSRRIAVRSRLAVVRVPRLTKVGDRILIRGVARPAGRRRINVVVRGADGAVIRTTSKRHGGGFAVSSSRKTPASTGSASTPAATRLPARTSVAGSAWWACVPHTRPIGPGLYGNGMACGGTLYRDTRGVAHKTLPCGTRVTLRYGRKTVVARVVDRGPYVAGREFDLTEAIRDDLGFGGVGTVWTNR